MKVLFLIASALYCFGSASKFGEKRRGKASGGHQSESWTAAASKRSGPSGPRRFVRKPGGHAVELLDKEVLTEAKDRHSTCDFQVLDAKSPDFKEKLHRSSYKPLLILNAVENWNVEDWSKDSWHSILQKEGVVNTLRDVYPWKMNSRFACCYPNFPDPVSEYFSLWNQKNGTRADGTVEFAKDNGVIWDNAFIADDKKFPGSKYPVPEWLPKNDARFLAFHAYGTSNGFHTHPTSQWLTQLRGYKSWYFLPPEIFTFPDDWTSLPHTDVGFYSEPVLEDTNTVCGYKPQDPLLKRHLQSCTAGPGEIVLVPKRWWHATCSLDEFLVATGGKVVDHIDTPNQAYRTFPEEDRTEDNLAMLQKHFLSFPESRRPDKNIADRMARMLLKSRRGVEWQKMVFRIQVQRPKEANKTVYFYNDHAHPVELYAKPKLGHEPDVHVTSIGPHEAILVETHTDWKFAAKKMFSAKRADGIVLQEFSVLPGFGRDEHVVLGENSVRSFQGSDELMERLQAWHTR